MSKNILIATPCTETVSAYYNTSLVEALQYLQMRSGELEDIKYSYQAFFTSSSSLETKSNIVKYAKKIEATHIIWVNSNMLFPMETFFQLISHNKDFVAVNYSTNRAPFKFTALSKKDDKNFDIVSTIEETTGLQKVSAVKMGLCITSISCFDDNEKPWFNFTYNETEDDYLIDDDYTFCLSIEDKVDIHVDHDLSKSVRHIGIFPYHFKNPYQNSFQV